jgi:hypothetical protein
MTTQKRDLEYYDPITLEEAIAANYTLFHRLVNADMREMCHPSVSAALRSPELVDRWIYHLNNIKRRIESQLARHKTKIQAMLGDQARIDAFVKQEAAWKSGAISMRSSAEGKLAEARYISNGYRNELLAAIKEHRERVLADPDDTEAADEGLWKTLR